MACDVLGIGNAIVDVIAQCDDSFLDAHKLTKGSMMLIDEPQAHKLYEQMGSGLEISGGSAANSMVGVASFGGQPGYIGKVRDDGLGKSFSSDINQAGVSYRTVAATAGPATARCLVLVTPDGERTMNTFLGASGHLSPTDIDENEVAAAQMVYLEGYLWDRDEAKQAFIKAADIARQNKRQVSLTLSDVFCVERHRESFLELIRHHVDVVFANEAEVTALYQCSNFEDAARLISNDCSVAVLTRSAKGSVIIADGDRHEIAARKVDRVVDSTGAGDLYAAGFLFGFRHGKSLPVCGQLGALAAAEVISHIGARPQADLKQLAVAAKLL